MKIYRLLFLITLFFSAVSCEEEESSRIEPDGDAITNFDFPEGEVFAPAKVVITNRSKYGHDYSWEFPGGKMLDKGGLHDVSVDTGINPDTIVYELPGTYKVKLTANQDGKIDTLTKRIVVKKMQPQIIVPQNILYLQEVQFNSKVFKYPGQDVTYSWTFANGQPSTSTVPNPKVTFSTPGVHAVTLTINDGQETLTTTAQVTVLDELVKTIYFTDVKTGKLYKKRFTQRQVSQPIQLPVNVGLHPLGVSVFSDRVIVTNAGGGVAFTTANADGRIFSVDLHGQNEATITTATGDYQNDPFSSTVDENGNVWWVTRRNGVFSLPSTARDAAYPAARIVLTGAQAGVASVFGWLDGDVQAVNGEIWYSKHGSTGRGLYRYNPAGQFISRIEPLKDVRLRSFAVDTKNSKIYFAVNFTGGGVNAKGLYVCNLDGTNITLIDPLANFSTQGGANEQTYVTDIAIDNNPDDGSAGYVYYGYRDANDVNASGTVVGTGANSGVKRYKLDGSQAPDFLVTGFIPYGLAIDHVKR